MIDSSSSQKLLTRSWWLVFPTFTGLTLRLAVERSCGDPHDLLPSIASRPALAWPIAAIYVLGHAWLVAAYLMTVFRAHDFAPPISVLRSIWQRSLSKCVLMAVAFAIEHAPLPTWHLVGELTRCRAL